MTAVKPAKSHPWAMKPMPKPKTKPKPRPKSK